MDKPAVFLFLVIVLGILCLSGSIKTKTHLRDPIITGVPVLIPKEIATTPLSMSPDELVQSSLPWEGMDASGARGFPRDTNPRQFGRYRRGRPSAVREPWDVNIDSAQRQPFGSSSPIPAHPPPFISEPGKADAKPPSPTQEWPVTNMPLIPTLGPAKYANGLKRLNYYKKGFHTGTMMGAVGKTLRMALGNSGVFLETQESTASTPSVAARGGARWLVGKAESPPSTTALVQLQETSADAATSLDKAATFPVVMSVEEDGARAMGVWPNQEQAQRAQHLGRLVAAAQRMRMRGVQEQLIPNANATGSSSSGNSSSTPVLSGEEEEARAMGVLTGAQQAGQAAAAEAVKTTRRGKAEERTAGAGAAASSGGSASVSPLSPQPAAVAMRFTSDSGNSGTEGGSFVPMQPQQLQPLMQQQQMQQQQMQPQMEQQMQPQQMQAPPTSYSSAPAASVTTYPAASVAEPMRYTNSPVPKQQQMQPQQMQPQQPQMQPQQMQPQQMQAQQPQMQQQQMQAPPTSYSSAPAASEAMAEPIQQQQMQPQQMQAQQPQMQQQQMQPQQMQAQQPQMQQQQMQPQQMPAASVAEPMQQQQQMQPQQMPAASVAEPMQQQQQQQMQQFRFRSSAAQTAGGAKNPLGITSSWFAPPVGTSTVPPMLAVMGREQTLLAAPSKQEFHGTFGLEKDPDKPLPVRAYADDSPPMYHPAGDEMSSQRAAPTWPPKPPRPLFPLKGEGGDDLPMPGPPLPRSYA